MKLLILDEHFDTEYDAFKYAEVLEFIRILGEENVAIYTEEANNSLLSICKPLANFEEDQKNFDCIYAWTASSLEDKKIKIPFFYCIFTPPIAYSTFDSYYSQFKGAQATFLASKTINKYAEWANLNPYWISEPTDMRYFNYQYKKFFTPQLQIGYIGDPKILKNIIKHKKSNWIFHTLLTKELVSDNALKMYEPSFTRLKQMRDVCQILICTDESTFPTFESRVFMSAGTILISTNLEGNNSNILFDKVHYMKATDCSANTIIELLKYVDKRREKLERMSLASRKIIEKYFETSKIVRQKLEIMQLELL